MRKKTILFFAILCFCSINFFGIGSAYGQNIQMEKLNKNDLIRDQYEKALKKMDTVCSNPKLNSIFKTKTVSDSTLSLMQNKTNALLNMLPLGHDETTMFLKELFILIYEIFAIFTGHNIVSWIFAFTVSSWFLIPAVMIVDLTYITIGDGGILESILISFADLLVPFQDIFYKYGLIGGAIALCFLPFIIILGSIQIILMEGFQFSGAYMQQVMNDLRYVFYPSNYEKGYQKYLSMNMNDFSTYKDDLYRLYYELGIIGTSLYPFFILYCFFEATIFTVFHNLKYHNSMIYPE